MHKRMQVLIPFLLKINETTKSSYRNVVSVVFRTLSVVLNKLNKSETYLIITLNYHDVETIGGPLAIFETQSS
jgi:hypothetical protein